VMVRFSLVLVVPALRAGSRDHSGGDTKSRQHDELEQEPEAKHDAKSKRPLEPVDHDLSPN
jgi:hypothetical protein